MTKCNYSSGCSSDCSCNIPTTFAVTTNSACKMRALKLILYSIAIVIRCYAIEVTSISQCGPLPRPFGAQLRGLTNMNQENSSAIFDCVYQLNYQQELKCNKNGTWTGIVKCGITPDNDVTYITISNGTYETHFNVTQVPNTLNHAINFAAYRAPRVSTAGSVYDKKSPLTWTITLTNPMTIAYVRIDLSVTNENAKVDIVEVNVSSDRKCEKKATNKARWSTQDGRLADRLDFWFNCELHKSYVNESEQLSTQVMQFRTVTNKMVEIDLAGVFVTLPARNCGLPAAPPNVVVEEIASNAFSAKCDNFSQTSSGNETIVRFDSNCNLQGSFPYCIPEITCTNALNWGNVAKVHYENVRAINDTTYYVVNNTVAYITCESKDVQKIEVRTCHNGRWKGGVAQVCRDRAEQDTGIVSLVTIVLIAILTVCAVAIVSLILFARKVIANRALEQELRRQNTTKSADYEQVRYSIFRRHAGKSGDYEQVDIHDYDYAQVEFDDYEVVQQQTDIYDDVN